LRSQNGHIGMAAVVVLLVAFAGQNFILATRVTTLERAHEANASLNRPAAKQDRPKDQPAREVRAQRFVLVDRNGRVRGTIGLDAFEDTVLQLNDRNGKARIAMRVPEEDTGQTIGNSDDATISLRDTRGVERTLLFASGREGGSMIMFKDKGGKLRAAFGQTLDEARVLTFYGARGDKPVFNLEDNEGRVSIQMTALGKTKKIAP
jgi:hypothetical protein